MAAPISPLVQAGVVLVVTIVTVQVVRWLLWYKSFFSFYNSLPGETSFSLIWGNLHKVCFTVCVRIPDIYIYMY